jgi:benzylsuccinate CoA-transferase BbsF subunit
MAADPRFDTLLNRKRNEDELNNIISEWTTGRTPEVVMEQLQTAGVPAGVIKNTADMYVDPQLNARGMYWKMNHPEVGEFTHLGQSFRLSETPARPYRPSPLLGEHTQYICSEILGMSDEEFVNLMQAGVFE